jgi:CTP:molybdopterin cytidylyltransferase MocA
MYNEEYIPGGYMPSRNANTYPILVLCGRDLKRRELLEVLDPEGKYPSKGLLPMHGKRVMDWHLEALFASKYVGELYLIGLKPEEYQSTKKVNFIPCELTATVLEKFSIGGKYLQDKYPDTDHLVVSTSDAPGILTESIDTFIETLIMDQDIDVLLGGSTEDGILKEFPEHGRVLAKFTDYCITPGEMMAYRYSIIPKLKDEIEQMTVRRRQFNRRSDTSKLVPLMKYLAKKPRLWTLIVKYLTGSLSIPETERILSKAYDMKLRAVVVDDPGFGMDMDLPEDYQRLTDYVEKIKIASV